MDGHPPTSAPSCTATNSFLAAAMACVEATSQERPARQPPMPVQMQPPSVLSLTITGAGADERSHTHCKLQDPVAVVADPPGLPGQRSDGAWSEMVRGNHHLLLVLLHGDSGPSSCGGLWPRCTRWTTEEGRSPSCSPPHPSSGHDV
jgi:hypothetical protein